jgi:hypothetical protein
MLYRCDRFGLGERVGDIWIARVDCVVGATVDRNSPAKRAPVAA